jgi:2-dehydro-3-deoxy-D-gluconate 5-dehydrogenase
VVQQIPALFDLSGRTALVTGARRGIGLAMASALAGAGADVVAVSAAMESSGSEVEKRVREAGRRFTAYQVDFADRAAVTEFAATAAGLDVDILINNAGTISRAPAVDHSDEEWDRVLEVDLSSQFVLTRAIGRTMLARGSGKVVFTASLLSYQGGITVPGYAAAKSGIAGLTRALANEWAGRGVNVNAIVPGYVATDNTAALRRDTVRSQTILDRIPAGRWGTPDDFAGVAVFLASAASDYVNGTLIAVDGGWLGR